MQYRKIPSFELDNTKISFEFKVLVDIKSLKRELQFNSIIDMGCGIQEGSFLQCFCIIPAHCDKEFSGESFTFLMRL